jgi:hypothetical protein
MRAPRDQEGLLINFHAYRLADGISVFHSKEVRSTSVFSVASAVKKFEKGASG